MTSRRLTDISSVANNGLVIFGEGYTEYYFYEKCITTIRNVSKCQPAYVKVENVKGIGNFIRYPSARMKNFIIVENKDIIFSVLLCYDTDVYELQAKPNFKWSQVVKEIKGRAIPFVAPIKQEKSIEDWMLKDRIGVLEYLSLDIGTRIPNKRGIQVMEELYRKANRVYVHGNRVESARLIEALNMNIIIHSLWGELQPLLEFFDVQDRSLFQ